MFSRVAKKILLVGVCGVGALMLGTLQNGCGEILDSLVLAEVGVGTHDLSFSTTVATAPTPQTVEASCTIPGSGTGFFSDENCAADVTVDQTWLRVDPDAIYGVEDVTVSIDPTGLAAGIYTGTIHVEYLLVSPDDEEDIAVTLTVTDAP